MAALAIFLDARAVGATNLDRAEPPGAQPASAVTGETSEHRWSPPLMNACNPRGVDSALSSSWERIEYLMKEDRFDFRGMRKAVSG
ncbi:hypothetical protein EVAR_37431_1 [Eumeta japonica]|uniref:Uncharacterized protein n=1 Tax=Eumeta variegata TaxID=151549 RepID=A0A4C1WH15_EUMVA|nr:hypothetical protein EVAR_37431_1 [Eumeta japonica]